MKLIVPAIIAVALLIAAPAPAFEFTDCGQGPCFWESYPVSYFINDDGNPNLSNEVEIVRKSFNRWEMGKQTLCVLDFHYEGRTPIKQGDDDGVNVISWITEDWEYQSQVLAVTQCWHDATGKMSDCDILMNAEDYDWDIGENGGSEIDLRSTLTHEIGHFWGLGHSEIPEATLYAYYNTRSNASDLDYDDIDGARSFFCPDGNLPMDDMYEQDDSRALADYWEEPPDITGLRLYDDDWFRMTVPAGKRVKVSVLDNDPDRSKTIYLAERTGHILEGAPCDGDCAVALGEPAEEDVQINVVVRGEFDANPISIATYDLLVEFVNPGQEGKLFDDDDSDDDHGSDVCGCDPQGGFGGVRPGSAPPMALLFLLSLFGLYALRRFSLRVPKR